ncbi:MAG TPA: glycosyltransferase family 4 protein [Candidatus Limnocylindrales bacterium]|jgi:glycosyltransferase involved in cell wall biosynthesis|nr:glycosyltransferase family 4 protein [Candidatus Limnocylindrales bacterium]
MRVALVATSLRLAGAEKQFVYIARALFAAGIQTKVFYLGAGDYYQNLLHEAKIPLCHIFHPKRPLFMLTRLIRETLSFRPHAVMASQFGDLIFAGPAGRLCNALVLGGVRSDGFYELRTSGHRSGFLLALAHALIANSYRAKQNLVSKGIDADKIAVLPNVIDLAEFDRRAAAPYPNEVPAGRIPIVAVGTLQPCKRFDRFLEALAVARDREPAIFGVLAGKDLGLRAILEQKARDLGLLPGHVAFLGECHQVPSLLRYSRLLVLCSDYEGFPNVILEAMAAGLSVVTTPAGDAPRIVQEGVTGYVVKTDDTRGLADCICRLAANPGLSAQLGGAGRMRVLRDYNVSCLADRLLAVLRDHADKKRKTSLLRTLNQTKVINESAATGALSAV